MIQIVNYDQDFEKIYNMVKCNMIMIFGWPGIWGNTIRFVKNKMFLRLILFVSQCFNVLCFVLSTLWKFEMPVSWSFGCFEHWQEKSNFIIFGIEKIDILNILLSPLSGFHNSKDVSIQKYLLWQQQIYIAYCRITCFNKL